MDIHKPHAAKNWREFSVEIGTIVLGILIALGLDALVQAAHERRVAAEAREAVRSEISLNLGMMQRRRQAQPCVARRLDELEQVVTAARTGRPYVAPKWVGRPGSLPVVSRRWTAASQSGRASLFDSAEQANYATLYYSMETYAAMEDQEQVTWATLRSMAGVDAMSPAMVWGLQQALAQARYQDYRQRLTTFRAFERAAILKIPATAFQQARFRMDSVCVPIGTDRATAQRLVGNPVGEP